MPDFAMCKDSECPSRFTCERFTATPSGWQSYVDFRHYPGTGACHAYIIDRRTRDELHTIAHNTVAGKETPTP